MPSNAEVFKTINDAVNNSLRSTFGPPSAPDNEKLPAVVAVALMQLSLRYFVDTGAPKEVIVEFFGRMMGEDAHADKRLRVEKDSNRLIISDGTGRRIV